MKHEHTYAVTDENDEVIGLFYTDESPEEAKATLEGVARKMTWEQREADFATMAWLRS